MTTRAIHTGKRIMATGLRGTSCDCCPCPVGICTDPSPNPNRCTTSIARYITVTYSGVTNCAGNCDINSAFIYEFVGTDDSNFELGCTFWVGNTPSHTTEILITTLPLFRLRMTGGVSLCFDHQDTTERCSCSWTVTNDLTSCTPSEGIDGQASAEVTDEFGNSCACSFAA